MIVCQCKGVRDRQVRRAVEVGAASIDEIAQSCGAGARCGGCWPLLADMLVAAGHDLATMREFWPDLQEAG